METQTPRVTVVTVNYNMREGLEKTIRSVGAQTYPNLEYIVVDGASTDGSQDTIRAHQAQITRWTSERDRNLYDGMNKGVAAATGDWLLFMNSGDTFADPRVVADMFAAPHPDADIIYGDVIWRYERENIDRPVPAEAPSVLPLRMHCSHQSIFTRTALLREYPFDLSLLIADYDFLLRAFATGRHFQFVDRTVAITTKGGRSDRQRLTVLRQQQQVLARYGLRDLRWRLRYPVRVAHTALSLFLRERLPARWARWIFRRQDGVAVG